ncbi:hypothetical protein B0H15DRAFT_185276 [Mycena belliarum]|uniref:Uncharacterized protein n=1 Tax=Mycena belliarum TaxID=1033014 RepID=A0AAD6U5U7_9AGAR|nr:hypothetical protein B0H15DRAFT_185276 [Mycena belliae]
MADAFAIAAGGFNVASFVLGSGPQTVAYLSNKFSGPGLQPSATMAQDVLTILEKYEHLLTDAERTEIMVIFLNLKLSLGKAEAEHKSRNAFQKLIGYSKGRKAAGKILKQADAGSERAINISEKARLRAIHLRHPPATSNQSGGPYPPGSTALTASMISLPFRAPTTTRDPVSFYVHRNTAPAEASASAQALHPNEDPFAETDIASAKYPSTETVDSLNV